MKEKGRKKEGERRKPQGARSKKEERRYAECRRDATRGRLRRRQSEKVKYGGAV